MAMETDLRCRQSGFDPVTMPDHSPLMDGFLYVTQVRYTAGIYAPLALSQLEVLRRANLLRPRWYVVPDDINTPVLPYDTTEYQVSLTPGSYLWAVTLVQYNSDFEPVAPGNILIQVTDACTNIPLFSDFASGGGISVQPTAPSGTGSLVPMPLPSPRLILAPGLVNVEVANNSGTAITAQLVLYFAEPCLMTGEGR